MSSEITPQMREMINDLRKKIDKARPVIAQVEKGELKVLSEAQQRQVDMFPTWKRNIELLQKGEMPPRNTGAESQATAESQEQATLEEESASATHATPARSTVAGSRANAAKGATPKNAKNTPNARNSKSGGQASPSSQNTLPDGEPIPQDVIQLAKKLLTLPKKVQTALIDLYVKKQIDTSKMAAITKEYDDLCKLRRDVMTGKIEVPTRVQEARLKLVDVVKREMNLETEKIKAQGERIKITIQIEMAEQLAAMSPQQRQEVEVADEEDEDKAPANTEDKADEEKNSAPKSAEVEPEGDEKTLETAAVAADDETTAPKLSNENEATHKPEVEVTAVKDEETPVADTKPKSQPPQPKAAEPSSSEEDTSSDDEDDAPPPPPADDDDDGFMFGGAMFDEEAAAKADKKAKKAAKAAAKAKAAEEEQQKNADADQDAEEAGQKEVEGEAANEDQQPEVPSAPKEIDWTELKVIRNRVALEQKVVTDEDRQRLSAPSNTSAATGTSRGRSASNVRSSSSSAAPPNPFQITSIAIDEEEVSKLLLSKQAASSSSSGGGGSAKPKEGNNNNHKNNNTAQNNKNSTTKGNNNKGNAANNANTSAAAAPTTSSAISNIHATVVARVQRDFVICLHNPLPNVKFVPSNETPLLWHVNVSPLEGPLMGVIVPLEIRFTELYPQDPPVVRCKVDVPHPSISNAGMHRDVLCFEHTRDNVWSPSYGVFSILTQLQTFFNTDNFAKLKGVLGASFKQRIGIARAECSRYTNVAIGHFPSHPYPPLPVYNGPFEKPSVKFGSGGELQGPGAATWVHSYARTGTHIFKLHLLSDSPRLVIGIAAPNGATGERVGNDEYGWGFSTGEGQNGTLRHKGRPVDKATLKHRVDGGEGGNAADDSEESEENDQSVSAKSESPSTVTADSPSHSAAEIGNNSSLGGAKGGGALGEIAATLKANTFKSGDVIQFTINFTRRFFSITLLSDSNGSAATTLYSGVPMPTDLEALVPTIHLSDRSKVILELNIHTKSLLEFNTLRAQQAASPQASASPTPGKLISPKSPTDNSVPVNAASSGNEKETERETESKQNNNIEIARKPVRCVITLAPPEEAAPLGVVVSVGRDPTTFMPSTISFRDAEYVSAKAFPQYKAPKASVGRRRDAFIALALNKENATKNLAAIKNSITLLCRNPDAATTYTPPFKPVNVWPVLTRALQSIIEEPIEDRPLVNRYESFIQMIHVLSTLYCLVPEVAQAIESIIKNFPAGVTEATLAGTICAVAAVTPLGDEGNAAVVRHIQELVVQMHIDKKHPTASEAFQALTRQKRRYLVTAIVFSLSLRQDLTALSTPQPSSVLEGLNVLEGSFTDSSFVQMSKTLDLVTTWEEVEKLLA